MDIKELNSFKLSDAIKFHDKLNPRLWRGDRLDPAVKKQLLLIAEDFIEELGLASLDVEDITVSGSNAAFTYTPHSDLDLHILVDMSKLPSNEVYRELFQAKKTLYNDSHNITIHGVPIELYVQDTNEPVVSLGEYSILNDKWIKRPTKRRANLDQNLTREKFDRLKELVLLALATRNLDRVNRTLKTIKRYRKAGLDKGGEFSPENLAFKAIRKQGGIQKLYDLRNKLHSETLTIENMYVNPPKDDLAERLSKEFEDYHPNAKPRGPEFPPTMPAGTVRVDVSDVYDWYKLGQHISNMKGLGKHDFGKGPPSTVLSFGDEDTEHQYIKDLEKTGLTTTDIDPVDPKQPKGMKRQKTDPAYNVNESSDSTVTVYHGNQGGIDENKLYMPMWFSTNYNSVLEYTGDDGFVLAAELTPKKTLVIDGKPGLGREINTAKENWRQLLSQGYDSIVQDYGKMQDWVVLDSSIIHIAEKLSIDESSEEFGGIQMHFEDDEDEIFVQALAGQKKLGHVLFVKQSNNILLPQDLEVDERFRGQGIASTMYDYVKSKGYKIRRSGQQTIAGAGFWGKHRSGQNVWEASEHIPDVLYHATYKPRLKSIKLRGLGAGGKRNWEDSKRGIVYLAIDPEVAVSYAESSDMVPDDWLDEIIVLEIPTAVLDKSKLILDQNVIGNEGDTLEYHGIIPFSAVRSVQLNEASEYVPSAKEITETTFAGKDPMSFKSPNGGTPIMLLVTGQGSRYLMTSDGMVLRNKSFHASTGGEDQGMKDWSGAIEFYEPNEKPGGVPFALSVGKAVEKKLPVALSNTKDGKRALMIYDGKQWRVAKISDIYKNVASTDAPIIATYSKSPKLNWNVLDYDVDSSKRIVRAHPGSPVTHGISLNKKDVTEVASRHIPGDRIFFFDYGFDPEVKQFVLSNQFNNPSLSCQTEVKRWAKKLHDAGLSVGIQHGFYLPNHEQDDAEGHTWLTVEGSIFDPTAGQFDDNGEGEYQVHETEDLHEASGYIPSNKEKNDSRFKTALTVDVKPDSIKKNAKAFNWKTSRAGIPPEANTNGLVESEIEKLSNELLEALKPSQYRNLIKGWDKSRYADIFSKYPDTDRNAYRIYLPLPAPTSEPKSKVAPEVEKHLASKGYTIKDYTGGLATDGRREMRIGKLLSDTPDVAKQFTNDPARAASKQSQLVVISRHPYDIAGMSTDRGWTSCMNLDGMHADYVPVDIRKGTIVAYLINADDRDIKNPIARIAIKPFVNTANPDEVVFGAENKVYGTASPAFKSAVIKWVNQVNKAGALEGVFVLKPGLYSDSANRPKIRIKDKKLAAQMNTFAKNPWAIIDMPDPPESLQLAAIAMGGPTIIKYIKNPTEKAQLTAVMRDSDVIQHIKNPTEKVQLAAVKQYGYVIKYIENPSEDVQMAAVKENVWSIQHIKNPSKAVKDFADRYFENFRKNELVESPINSENKIILSTDPDWYGAEVGDYKATGPVVDISTNELVGFEPDDKMSQPKSKANVKKIVAGLKQGAKLPPILVRKYKNGYQVIDGHHRFWAYKLLGVKSIPAQVVPDSDIVMNEQAFTQINEAFNTPYPYKWENEENDYGDWDAVTRLPDGTPLHIMFSYDNDDNSVTLSFFRNNTQDVTGEGDAFRIFATVMAALNEYNKKIKPRIIYFTASKDDDDEAGTESRTKLYNRMVAKYASQMGYNATIEENEYGIDYTLVRISNKTK